MKPVSTEDEKKIKDCLRYEPETGKIYWKSKPNYRSPIKVGAQAGSAGSKGYRRVFLCNREFQVHQIVWFFETEQWPEIIDHVNGNRSDNRFCNLRVVDYTNNARNRVGSSSTKMKGVYKTHSKRSPFKASIYFDGVCQHLGYFSNRVDAARAYDAAARKYFGEFARLNFHQEHQR